MPTWALVARHQHTLIVVTFVNVYRYLVVTNGTYPLAGGNWWLLALVVVLELPPIFCWEARTPFFKDESTVFLHDV
jgi:hypothetical protein